MSRWNRLIERLLAEDDLTIAELRLALALARLLPGWRRPEARLGRQMLRDVARLDGRDFERARDGLVRRGLLDYTPGKPGRGNRGNYSLLPWIDEKRPLHSGLLRGWKRPLSVSQKRPLHSGHALIEAKEKQEPTPVSGTATTASD